jgi:hypothetical protein
MRVTGPDGVTRFVDSQRLQNFRAYVNKCRIPYISGYSGDSTTEFYAEAYTIWRNDPEYLKTKAKKLVNWFGQLSSK